MHEEIIILLVVDLIMLIVVDLIMLIVVDLIMLILKYSYYVNYLNKIIYRFRK